MFETQLPGFRKFQTISAVAAGIGFIIGMLIPARAIFMNNWEAELLLETLLPSF